MITVFISRKQDKISDGKWRKERDSNPRTVSGSAVFKTAALDHSAILPFGLKQTNPIANRIFILLKNKPEQLIKITYFKYGFSPIFTGQFKAVDIRVRFKLLMNEISLPPCTLTVNDGTLFETILHTGPYKLFQQGFRFLKAKVVQIQNI